jgi:hypothetical protein
LRGQGVTAALIAIWSLWAARAARDMSWSMAASELVDPGPVHPVSRGDLSGSLVVDEQGGDGEARLRTRLRHGRGSSHSGLSPMTCEGVAHVSIHLSSMT